MIDLNTKHNRVVWFDIFVNNLEKAIEFYSAMLDISIKAEKYNDFEFAVLEHDDGNGGCLVKTSDEITPNNSILIYLNVNNRIRDAIDAVKEFDGEVLEDTHPIGPFGFRAIIKDCEGNKVALHSESNK